MDQTILIIDDDMQLTSFLSRFLAKHGFKVRTASSGAKARGLFQADDLRLIVLDLNLPDADGFDLVKEFRAEVETPIIMLTARDEVFDRIVGLELGADDYLTKPYEPRELLARIKAVLRRFEVPANGGDGDELPDSIRFEGLELDIVKRRLRHLGDDRVIALTGAEFTLLCALVRTPGQIVSRDQLMDALYGNSVAITDRAVDAHVSRLRRKIDREEARSSLIQSVRGEGYVLAVTVDVD
ncbi:response regulator transcription factor [Aliiroseovarius sp.]|uniref:response regulator n=1 Tax=Aliiroseovarius sp. TaxID=1872442 RepID=UPI00260F5B22|nr:response regulator transcription factor [Aliiroseovarius sp.]